MSHLAGSHADDEVDEQAPGAADVALATPSGLPLEGIRVLELPGEVATRYCGRLFAQLGAEVVAVGRAEGDEDLGPDRRAYGRWLDQGKVHVGSAADVDGHVDLVVAGQDPAATAAAERLVAALAAPAPTLLALTWFDPAGPYGAWRGNDEVVHALSGVAYSFGEREGPPTLPQGHAPQVMAGASACNLGLAVLLDAPRRRPRRVDVNVLESVLCVSEVGAVAAVADPRARSTRLGVNRFSPTYPCSSHRSADGWVGVTCLTPAQWAALCTMIDRPDLAADERLGTAFRRLMRGDEVDEALAPAFSSRTTDEWVAEGIARRIPIAPMLRPGDLPHQEHWRARGSFAPVDADGVLGPTLPFRMVFDGATSERWVADEVVGPLAGLRVVDFSMGWAGPQATRTLADLGADVVKVESVSHPDWYRGWEADQGGDPPPIELRASFNTLNRNKRDVALELTTAEGLAAARALVATADVVIENFAAGVLEGLGLGQQAQRALRPGLVSLSMPAFGAGGPLSGVRAYGSTVEQASGLPFVNGEAGWPPSLQHVAYGDPVAGVYAVTAILAALAGRSRLGGADIDLAQVACLFELGAHAIVGESLAGRPLPRTGNRRASRAPCCVVPAAGVDEWLAVAVDTDEAWRGLCRVLGAGAWPAEPALGDAAGRRDAAEPIEGAVAAWAQERAAAVAAAELQSSGVPAAPVQPVHTLTEDPQLLATGCWVTMDRRHVGRHTLAAPPFRLDGERPAARRPAPTLGEHTAEVLAEIG